MKNFVSVVCLFFVLVMSGCASGDGVYTTSSSNASTTNINTTNADTAKVESAKEQLARYLKQFEADIIRVAEKRNSAGRSSVIASDFDEILAPKEVSGNDAYKFLSSAKPGDLYWFKIRAIYKGYNAEAGKLYLEDLPQQKNTTQKEDLYNNLLNAFGIDTSMFMLGNSEEPTRVKESNTVATFYCSGFRLAEGNESASSLDLVFIDDSDIVVLFNSAKFVIASGMSYITKDSVTLPNTQNIMMSAFTGGMTGNNSDSVFDPVKYSLIDLYDARVAMNKKDIRNDYTNPRQQIKYVSEVLIKGQNNTTLIVSTIDGTLTERMDFIGRLGEIKTGNKVRIYYTIAKDPLEEWKVQALERL